VFPHVTLSPIRIDNFLPLYLRKLCSPESRTLAHANSFLHSMLVRLTAVSPIASSSQDKFPRSVESLSRVSHFFVSICLDILSRFPGQAEGRGNAKVPSILYYDASGNIKAVGSRALSIDVINDAEECRWTKAEWLVTHHALIPLEFAHWIQVEASPSSQEFSICPYQGRGCTPTPVRKICCRYSDRLYQVSLHGCQTTYRGAPYGI
jgi:hypothetical protein